MTKHTFKMPGDSRRIHAIEYDDYVALSKGRSGEQIESIVRDFFFNVAKRAESTLFLRAAAWLEENAVGQYEFSYPIAMRRKYDASAKNGAGADIVYISIDTEVVIASDDIATLFKLTFGGAA